MGIFRRDDETEMMAVVFAALSEGADVNIVTFATKQCRVFPILADPVALNIVQVFHMGRGSVEGPAMTHDARLDGNAP